MYYVYTDYQVIKGENMDLRNYFDFIDDENIRIQGHRVYIDNVLSNYLWGEGPDELQQRYPQMSMEKIYATILYYLANKVEVDAYMARVEKGKEERYQEWLQTVASTPEYIERRERLLKAREKRITEGKASPSEARGPDAATVST